MNDKEKKLFDRAKALEEDLRIALSSSEDIKALKVKCKQLFEQLTFANEQNKIKENEKESALKQTIILKDHIERIMYQMKIQNKRFMEQIKTSHLYQQKLKKSKIYILKQNKIITSSKKYYFIFINFILYYML
jgi:hypothetical protein